MARAARGRKVSDTAYAAGFADGLNSPEAGRALAIIARTDLTERQKRQLLHKMRREVDAKMAKIERERRPIYEKIAHLKKCQAGLEAFKVWASEDTPLERAESSRLHEVIQAREADDLIFAWPDDAPDLPGIKAWFDEALPQAHAFLVQHDWAAAFSGATDFATGEFRYPAPFCAFEYRIGKRRCIALTSEDSANIGLIWQMDMGWIVGGLQIEEGWLGETDTGQRQVKMVLDQIRAISIALDADAARADIVRAPHKLNRARERAGKLPIRDHHIVSLKRSPRPLQLPATGHHASPRLHFRRGHWRHYELHKTWIRWTLVGNPDLGFIDKEYRA